MNIFKLDEPIRSCAQMHCDKHVSKMILESAQMLCTALWVNGQSAPYKAVHAKHPCTLWAAESLDNWLWLKELAIYLNEEFCWRYKIYNDPITAYRSYYIGEKSGFAQWTKREVPEWFKTP